VTGTDADPLETTRYRRHTFECRSGAGASSIHVVPYRRMIRFIQTENQMAKVVARRTKGAVTTAVRRVRGGRAGWVRKNVVMDQRKLDVARRALGVETETEAIDQALDFVAFREELARGFAAVRRSGGVDGVLEGRRKA
jgi:hypothetical protein